MASSSKKPEPQKRPPGSVLVHQFGPAAASYLTTSYPHPVPKARPDDFRKIHYTDNLPKSLQDELAKQIRLQKNDRKPRYVMNMAAYMPLESPEWNGSTNKDPEGCIWFLYFYGRRAPHYKWNEDPLPETNTLGVLAHSFNSDEPLSYAAFGAPSRGPPECIFLRSTDAEEHWHYRWGGLTLESSLAIQAQIEGGDTRHSDSDDEDLADWVGGRLRAITFGCNDSYVVYRGKNFTWGGDLPPGRPGEPGREEVPGLEEILRSAKAKNWSINNCVLNPCNPSEFMVAFNEDKDNILRISYAVHGSYVTRFEEIVSEWADGKGLRHKSFPIKLSDEDCAHQLPDPALDHIPYRPKRAAKRRSDDRSMSMDSLRSQLPPHPRPQQPSYGMPYPSPPYDGYASNGYSMNQGYFNGPSMTPFQNGPFFSPAEMQGDHAYPHHLSGTPRPIPYDPCLQQPNLYYGHHRTYSMPIPPHTQAPPAGQCQESEASSSRRGVWERLSGSNGKGSGLGRKSK